MIALALLILLSTPASGEGNEAMVMWNKDRLDHQVTDAEEPVTFHLAVVVSSYRDLVQVEYQVEGAIGWRMIVFDGETEPYTGWDQAFFYIPDRTYALNVTFTPPFGALNTTYWFTLQGHLQDNLDVTDIVRLGITVRQYADFEWGYGYETPPGGEFSTYPSNRVSSRLPLFNTGNGYDSFLILADLSQRDRGWELEILNGVDRKGRTPVLPPDPFKKNPYVIDVTVHIPALERAGITCQVTMNASSSFDPSLARRPAFMAVTSLQYYNFQVNVTGPSSMKGIPGGFVVFTLEVNNLGNGWDDFTIKPIWNVDRNPGFTAGADPRTVSVDARSRHVVEYVVKVPEGAAVGEHPFAAEVSSSSSELSPMRRTLVVQVGSHYYVEMVLLDPGVRYAVPGDHVTFEVSVRNGGNTPDIISFEGAQEAPEGWSVQCGPSMLALEANATDVIIATVTVPTDFDKALIGNHSMTLTGSSVSSDALAMVLLEVSVVQKYRVEWMNDTTWPVRSVNPFERDSFTETRGLQNLGNDRDRLSLEWSSPHPGIGVVTASPWVVLNSGETRYVPFRVTVEESVPPGDYSVLVSAASEGRGSEPVVTWIDFRVDNIDVMVPPIPTIINLSPGDVVRSNLNIDMGDEVPMRMKVENNGTVEVDSVLVRVFDNYVVNGQQIRWNLFNFTTPPIAVGDRYIVGERPFTGDDPPLTWSPETAGQHLLEFRVYHPYQSNTDNDVGYLNVTVNSIQPRPPPPGSDSSLWLIATIMTSVVLVLVTIGVHGWSRKRLPR